MEKEAAKLKLQEAQSNLKQAEIILEMHENGVRELREDIENLKAIINKKDDWRDGLVDPKKDKHFYISANIANRYGVDWLTPTEYKRNAALLFREESHAKIMANKIQLMQEMYAFAHVKNEGWLPDWEDLSEEKFGILYSAYVEFDVDSSKGCNYFIFGVVVKSQEIAEEMLEEFGERIESIYNKQY